MSAMRGGDPLGGRALPLLPGTAGDDQLPGVSGAGVRGRGVLRELRGAKGHGTFLDAGELQAVVGFIQGGGLERARQRQIEDLKEQERRLKDQEARVLGGRYSTATGPLFAETGMRVGFDTLIGLFRDGL